MDGGTAHIVSGVIWVNRGRGGVTGRNPSHFPYFRAEFSEIVREFGDPLISRKFYPDCTNGPPDFGFGL